MKKTFDDLLNRWASIILGILIPGITRVFHPIVYYADEETASTNGAWIKIPPSFLGTDVRKNPEIGMGLLAHELGHWLQPLKEADEVEKETGMLGSVVNIILDIQLEELVALLFPPFRASLTAVRKLIGKAKRRDYNKDAENAQTFLDAVVILALMRRFCGKDVSSSYSKIAHPPMPQMESDVLSRAQACANEFARAGNYPARRLPAFLKEMARRYPELCVPRPPEGGPKMGSLAEAGEIAGRATDEISPMVSSGGERLDDLRKVVGESEAADIEDAETSSKAKEYPGELMEDREAKPLGELMGKDPDVLRTARRLNVRFKTPRGGLKIQAPERLDLHAAIRQDPCPFSTTIPSRFSGMPTLKVLLAVDRSGSMGVDKWLLAMKAAASIAKTVKESGGDARALIFNDHFWHAPGYDASALFADRLGDLSLHYAGGEETYLWLPTVWTLFPDHLIIVLTDGGQYGMATMPKYVPLQAKRRTFSVVIPDGDPNIMKYVSEKVVVVKDLNSLPAVFATLIPRKWVA